MQATTSSSPREAESAPASVFPKRYSDIEVRPARSRSRSEDVAPTINRIKSDDHARGSNGDGDSILPDPGRRRRSSMSVAMPGPSSRPVIVGCGGKIVRAPAPISAHFWVSCGHEHVRRRSVDVPRDASTIETEQLIGTHRRAAAGYRELGDRVGESASLRALAAAQLQQRDLAAACASAERAARIVDNFDQGLSLDAQIVPTLTQLIRRPTIGHSSERTSQVVSDSTYDSMTSGSPAVASEVADDGGAGHNTRIACLAMSLELLGAVRLRAGHVGGARTALLRSWMLFHHLVRITEPAKALPPRAGFGAGTGKTTAGHACTKALQEQSAMDTYKMLRSQGISRDDAQAKAIAAVIGGQRGCESGNAGEGTEGPLETDGTGRTLLLSSECASNKLGEANVLTLLGEAQLLAEEQQAQPGLLTSSGKGLQQSQSLDLGGGPPANGKVGCSAVELLRRAVQVYGELGCEQWQGLAHSSRLLGQALLLPRKAHPSATSGSFDDGNRVGSSSQSSCCTSESDAETEAGWVHLNNALQLFEQHRDHVNQAKTLGLVAEVRKHRGEHEQCAWALAAVLALSEEMCDERACANTLISLGDLHLQTADAAEAEPPLQQAVLRSRESGAKDSEASALRLLAEVQWELGRQPEAMFSACAAREGFHTLGLHGREAEALTLLSEMRRGVGDLCSAHEALIDAQRLYSMVGERVAEADTHMLLAELVREQSNAELLAMKMSSSSQENTPAPSRESTPPPVAADHVEESASSHSRNSSPPSPAALPQLTPPDTVAAAAESGPDKGDAVLPSRAERAVLVTTAAIEAATEIVKRAHKLYSEVGDKRGQADAALVLSELRLEALDHSAARSFAEEAQKLYENIGDIRVDSVVGLLTRISASENETEKQKPSVADSTAQNDSDSFAAYNTEEENKCIVQ